MIGTLHDDKSIMLILHQKLEKLASKVNIDNAMVTALSSNDVIALTHIMECQDSYHSITVESQ